MVLKHQNTYKHLLNFIGSPVRPVLSCFHYQNGDVVATNTHIVLKVKNLSPGNLGGFNFNPKTLEINTDAYPDIDRIIPTSFNSEWKITPTCCSVITKFLKGFPVDARIKVKINLDGLEISRDGISSLFPIRLVAGDNRAEFTCNVTYLKHILAFIADYTNDPVTFGFVSSIRPVAFKVDRQFTAVLAPIRTK